MLGQKQTKKDHAGFTEVLSTQQAEVKVFFNASLFVAYFEETHTGTVGFFFVATGGNGG